MELRIEKLSKQYPNGAKALQDVSLTIPLGMFGLLGPNGAGKSTLMRTIATLQEPRSLNLKDRLILLRSTLERHLRKVTPAEFQYLYDDMFENITLYENRAKSATYRLLPDGKYHLNADVELKKFRADGRGEEHQVPTHDWVDIGVTDVDGHYLYLQKHRMDSESAEFNVVVDKLPYKAGIDPINKLIDRKPDDNLMRVSEKK